jgi:type II secretion system protein N
MAKLPVRVPNVGPRTRLVLRYVGLTVFAVLTFVFALQMTFPYDRVKDKVVEGLSEKYDVTIGSVERGIVPGRVYFKAVTLRTRQTKPEETVTTFFIKQLEIDAGLLSLIGGTISVDIDAQIGVGTLTGSVQIGKFGRGDIAFDFTGSSLPGDALPMRALLGLPMTGKIEFSVAMKMPVEKAKGGKAGINWKNVRGNLTLACPNGCTFGDGKTKLKPLLKNTRNQVMVGEGIDFGKVTMDSLVAKASFKDHKLTLDKFETKSKDGELHVDYMMTLEREFGESAVTGCLRFRGSDDLAKREPRTAAAITTTGAELRSDGLFHIRLTDRFKDMKRLNQECGPNVSNVGNGEDFRGGGRNERPGLTMQPDEPAKVGSAALTPPIPAPAPQQIETPGGLRDGSAGSATGSGSAATPTGGPGVNTDGVTPPTDNSEGAPQGARERPGEQGRIENQEGSGSAGSGSAMSPAPAE